MEVFDYSDLRRTRVVEEEIFGPSVLFEQEPGHEMAGGYISDGAYAELLDKTVIVCADVVFYDPLVKTIYLATRRNLPMRGLWWIGGRVHAGETSLGAIQRIVQRETGLRLDSWRLASLNWMPRYHWSERQQEPRRAGSDNLCFMFKAQISPLEAMSAWSGLDANEYIKGAGLLAYTRSDLSELLDAGRLHPVIWQVYNEIFPSRITRIRNRLAGVIAG
ncbi:MAG TPA: NUDIX hydrolase [Candidatus Saccharimonadales bacterium]|nr:NUDIX hydrolase [Candidatus Saccharimonadales bacterium]